MSLFFVFFYSSPSLLLSDHCCLLTDKLLIQRRHVGCCSLPEVEKQHIAGNMIVQSQTFRHLFNNTSKIEARNAIHCCLFDLVMIILSGKTKTSGYFFFFNLLKVHGWDVSLEHKVLAVWRISGFICQFTVFGCLRLKNVIISAKTAVPGMATWNWLQKRVNLHKALY